MCAFELDLKPQPGDWSGLGDLRFDGEVVEWPLGGWEGDWYQPASLTGCWKGSRYLCVPNGTGRCPRDLSAAGWR